MLQSDSEAPEKVHLLCILVRSATGILQGRDGLVEELNRSHEITNRPAERHLPVPVGTSGCAWWVLRMDDEVDEMKVWRGKDSERHVVAQWLRIISRWPCMKDFTCSLLALCATQRCNSVREIHRRL